MSSLQVYSGRPFIFAAPVDHCGQPWRLLAPAVCRSELHGLRQVHGQSAVFRSMEARSENEKSVASGAERGHPALIEWGIRITVVILGRDISM